MHARGVLPVYVAIIVVLFHACAPQGHHGSCIDGCCTRPQNVCKAVEFCDDTGPALLVRLPHTRVLSQLPRGTGTRDGTLAVIWQCPMAMNVGTNPARVAIVVVVVVVVVVRVANDSAVLPYCAWTAFAAHWHRGSVHRPGQRCVLLARAPRKPAEQTTFVGGANSWVP